MNIPPRALIRLAGLIAAGLLAFPTNTLASGEGAFEVLDYGIYAGGLDNLQLQESTNEVRIRVGTTFGVRIRQQPGSSGSYSFKWSFPHMEDPESGRAWTAAG